MVAEILLEALSFVTIFEMWKFTVRSEIFRIRDISLEVLPSAVHLSTSISRFDNWTFISGINFGVNKSAMRKWPIWVSQEILKRFSINSASVIGLSLRDRVSSPTAPLKSCMD